MKKIIAISLFLVLGITSLFGQSQECDCKKDLDFLVEKIKNMPSYKKQIYGAKLIEFENTYSSLSNQMNSPIAIGDCFRLLHQQMMVINDLHSNIYFNKSYLNDDDANIEDKLNEFIKSEVYKNHPKTVKNLETLKNELASKPEYGIEGIYNYKDAQTIGVYEVSDSTYEGVVLSSDNKLWEIGQIQFTAHLNNFGKYDMFTYDITTRKLKMIKGLTYDNGRIWSYKKVDNMLNFEIKDKSKTDWEFKQLTKDVQYVYFGNFSSFTVENRKAFKDFYQTHKNRFNARHIIVDLRNNGGGNKKLSDPFIKLFKKSKAKLYIITNSFTGSNGEQFTVKLKNIKEAKQLGQTTFGIIAYGLNYGRQYKTPSGFFSILPTDLNFHEYYQYEGKGVAPDIKLDFKSDWIEQTLQIIKQSNQ